MTTSAMRGIFKMDHNLRQDFYAQLALPHIER